MQGQCEISHRAYSLDYLLADLPLPGLEAIDGAASLDPGVAPGHRGGELPLDSGHSLQRRLEVILYHLFEDVHKITVYAVIKTILDDVYTLFNIIFDDVSNVLI